MPSEQRKPGNSARSRKMHRGKKVLIKKSKPAFGKHTSTYTVVSPTVGFSMIDEPTSDGRQVGKASAGSKKAGKWIKDRKGKPTRRAKVQAASPSARANALLRGRRFSDEALSICGGGFSADEVRELLGNISERALQNKIDAQKIFFVRRDGSRRLFPAAQFTDGSKPIEGLSEVLDSLPTQNGWARLVFLTGKNYDLNGETPVDLLLNGEVDRVKAAASLYE